MAQNIGWTKMYNFIVLSLSTGFVPDFTISAAFGTSLMCIGIVYCEVNADAYAKFKI